MSTEHPEIVRPTEAQPPLALGSGSAFVVTAYRWGQRNAHSFVVGCFADLAAAKKGADEYVEYRGGKYACEVCEAGAWSEADEEKSYPRQVYYVESPYYGMCGDAGHFHPADQHKSARGCQGPVTVRELQNRIWELERFEKRLKWLHEGGGRDPEGCEWGVFRVKWNEQGQPIEVRQTLSDFSDLDSEMHREASLQNTELRNAHNENGKSL